MHGLPAKSRKYVPKSTPPPFIDGLPEKQCSIDDITERIAKRLYMAYVARKRLWSSLFCAGRFDDPPKDRKLWRGLAKFLLDHGCDAPERYILAQFSGVPPQPKHLQSDKCWKRYIDFLPKHMYDLEALRNSDAWNFLSAFISRAMTSGVPNLDAAIEAIISNPDLDISDLSRYSLAVSFFGPSSKLANAYKQSALAQLLTDPEGYRMIWKDYIPESLFEDANNILEYESCQL